MCQTKLALIKICLLVLIAGLVGTIPTDEASGSSPVCTVDADCFRDAVRALHKKDANAATALLLELIQQFPNTPWAGRAAVHGGGISIASLEGQGRGTAGRQFSGLVDSWQGAL